MHIAAVVLSVLLAVELAFTAIIKIAGTGAGRTNAAHLGISLRLSRFIGIAELAAVVGLLAGIAVKPLAIVTAAAVVLLMAGAVGYHLKARDYGVALLPAAITGAGSRRLGGAHYRGVGPSPPSPEPPPRNDQVEKVTLRRKGLRMNGSCRWPTVAICTPSGPASHTDGVVWPHQIAQFARTRRTNPEIGAELFLSARTVEWHLLREGHFSFRDRGPSGTRLYVVTVVIPHGVRA